MKLSKKYHLLMISCLHIFHSTAAAEKLPEDNFEAFRNRGLHEFFDKFSQSKFVDLGFEDPNERQKRTEEESRLKSEQEAAEANVREEEKRLAEIERLQQKTEKQIKREEEKREAEEVRQKLVIAENELFSLNIHLDYIKTLAREKETKLQLEDAQRKHNLLKARETEEERQKIQPQNLVLQKAAEAERIRLRVPLVAQGHEAIYQRFLNGVLIYRPDGKSDDGRINLRISDLVNPLEGTFDLSQCGDAGNYLSISTGYRKRKSPENASKVEMWFAPRFLIEKELNTTASHFKDIFPANWAGAAPVGIFWTWGGWDELSYMDCLTSQSVVALSSGNLYEKGSAAYIDPARSRLGGKMDYAQVDRALVTRHFMFIL